MEIIEGEDFKKRNFAPLQRQHPIATMLMRLEVGQVLIIKSGDWTWKRRSPAVIVTRVAKKSGRTFETFKESGVRAWAVKRVG